ncbi:MAG: biotin--[acetyl-CoA-carboxylase] ligase [bacterium]
MSIPSKIYTFDESENSVALAKQNINESPDGSVFLVKNLTSAHGRQGRSWKLYGGQIVVTLLLKPDLKQISKQDMPIRLTQLNMAITLGILSALEKYSVKLKWPNDFMIEHKKVGGMIVELVWSGSELHGIVVGFSINVNNIFEHTDELYEIATSLKQSLNKNFDINELQEKILKSIDDFYKKWKSCEFDQIFNLWREKQFYKNKIIQIHQKDGSLISGLFHDVLPSGELVLQQGNEEIIIPFYLVEQIK